jgi:hypothetical protein
MIQWKRLRTVAITAVVMIALLSNFAAAQNTASKYRVSTPPLTWNDISGSGNQIAWDVVRYWDGTSTTLPFDFKYENGQIPAGTTIYLFNGTVGLGTNMWSGYNYGGLDDNSFTNCLFPWGSSYVQMGDHASNTSWYNGASENYGIFDEVTGSVGSRVYTIQMNGVHTAWGALWDSPNDITNIQVKLYEATGVIQFLYTAHGQYMSGSYDAEVGINGGSSSFTSNIAVKGSWYTPNTDIQFDPPSPPAEFSLQPKFLNFGSVPTGQTLDLYDTLTSIGGSPLTVNSSTITGSTDYVIINPIKSPTILDPGSTYVFQIRFTPTNTGDRNATLTVVTTAADSAKQSCILDGTGLAPKVEYTFTGIYPFNTLFHRVALRFGDSSTQYFYVKNTGNGPLLFNSLQMIGLQGTMYSVIHAPVNPLPAGASDSIGIRFKPFLEGRPDAQFVINTNALNTPFDTVMMWGAGKLAHLVVAPSSGPGSTLHFDSVGIGDSVCAALVLRNPGTDTLVIQKQIVTYGDYDYTFYPLKGTETRIAPDQTRIVNVCFVPVMKGSRIASIRFYTNIPLTYPDKRDTSQFLINVTGTGVPYGRLAVGGSLAASAVITKTDCISDTIRNTGTAQLTLTSVQIHGVTSDDFVLSGMTLPYTLDINASKIVQVCFTAKSRGLEVDTLVVNGTTSTRKLTLALPILGTGLMPCMDATPNPVAFGAGLTLARSTGDSTMISVKNCGDVPMSFTAALTTGTSSNYTLMNASTSMIAPNKTGAIWVRFTPDTIGQMPGAITITPSESTLPASMIQFSGMGAGALVIAAASPKPTMVTKADTFIVTVTNNGNYNWVPSTPQIAGSEFKAVGIMSPDTIAPNKSGSLKVEFRPTTTGTRTATLSFPSSAPAPLDKNLPFTLTASGVALQGVSEITELNGFMLGTSFPNPAHDRGNIFVTVPQDAKITLSIVRLDGSAVMTAFAGDLSKGQHVLSFDVSQLASGTYFYVLESGATRLAREMIVAK